MEPPENRAGAEDQLSSPDLQDSRSGACVAASGHPTDAEWRGPRRWRELTALRIEFHLPLGNPGKLSKVPPKETRKNSLWQFALVVRLPWREAEKPTDSENPAEN